MSVSLKQVASHAGVSTSTVSRVLSGDERAQIALETQEMVRRSAQELGYRPNRFARSLITGRTHTIGLMISRLSNPFFLSLIESAESAAKAQGYNVFIDADGSHAEEYLQSGHLSDWPVDGVVMWTWSGQTLADFIGARAQKTPVVYVSEQARGDGAGSVTYDLENGARLAMSYVLERGYRRPALLVPYAPGDWQRPEWRAEIYRAQCRAAGVELRTIITPIRAETREAGFLAGLALAELPARERPDVLLCHNDILAIGAYHALLRAKVRVPQDIAILGFDGIEEGFFLDKQLSTVHIPMAEIGRQAIEILVAHLTGQSEHQQRVIPSRLIEGETV